MKIEIEFSGWLEYSGLESDADKEQMARTIEFLLEEATNGKAHIDAHWCEIKENN